MTILGLFYETCLDLFDRLQFSLWCFNKELLVFMIGKWDQKLVKLFDVLFANISLFEGLNFFHVTLFLGQLMVRKRITN